MLKPTPISSNLLHRGRIIEVSTEVLRYSNGREHELDLVRHPGAAAIVALDSSNRACFVRQYRHGIEDFLWEIPAGKLDRGEAPFDCAVRELRGGSWFTSPGYVRANYRNHFASDYRTSSAGIRLVREIAP